MSSCRVALVNPHFKGTFDGVPMGILYLASALEEAGHQVELHDFSGRDVSCDQAAKEVLAGKPQVVGITGTSPSHVEAMKFASIIRSHNSEVCLVKGGYHEKFGMWRDALRRAAKPHRLIFDYAVTTDGEAQIVEIANACGEGRDVRMLEGIVKPLPAGPTAYETGTEPVLSSFGHLIPARHLLLNPEQYRYQGIFKDVRATQLMTYRGCRFQCTFCAIPNSEFNHDLATIEEDIKGLVRDGYGAVFIDDGTFTVNWDRAREVCTLLNKHGLRWACQTRVDLVSRERLKHMAASGCTYVYYGLESGSHRVLKAIKKGFRLDQVKETVQLTQGFGMKAVTSFIFGVPLGNGLSDSREDWNASIDLILRARPNTVVPTIFAYYPGSPAWNSLPSNRQDEYRVGASRSKVWEWYDDGWGAIHAVPETVASEIRKTLEDRLTDFLWRDLESGGKISHAEANGAKAIHQAI